MRQNISSRLELHPHGTYAWKTKTKTKAAGKALAGKSEREDSDFREAIDPGR